MQNEISKHQTMMRNEMQPAGRNVQAAEPQAALGEELRAALAPDDPLGPLYALQLAADILYGELPAESFDTKGIGRTLGGLAYRLRAALAAAATPAPTPWRDIESAPKEADSIGLSRSVILGFAPDEEGNAPEPREGFWHQELGVWVSSLNPDWPGGPQPTHWMPLPAAPTREE